MTGWTSHALFPLTALAFAALSAFGFLALGLTIAPSLALALGVFASVLGLRNWWLGEEDRPLLAEELLELHEAMAAMERDAAEMREAMEKLARAVERIASPEAADARSQIAALEARVSEAEAAALRALEAPARTPPPGPEGEAAEAALRALAGLEKRLADHEARGRKIASAVTLALSETKRLSAELASGGGGGSSLDAPADAPTAQLEGFDITLAPVVALPEGRAEFFEAMPAGVDAEADAAGFLRSAGAAGHLEAAGRPALLFCNVSAETLRSELFLRALKTFLRARPDVAPMLAIELRQSAYEGLSAADHGLVERLADLGVVFSMDQVAHWRTDLEALGRLGFRFVKLDAAMFLERASAVDGAERLAARLAELGLTLIVENVSTEAEVAALRAAGVAFAQGAALGAPTVVRVEAPDPAGGGAEDRVTASG